MFILIINALINSLSKIPYTSIKLGLCFAPIAISGFNLTVTARNTYKVGSDEVDMPVLLKGINEIELYVHASY